MAKGGRSIKQIAAALKANACQAPLAAAQLGITRQAVNMRIAKSLYLQQMIASWEDDLLAKARGNVETQVLAGDVATSRWLLERRDRAYSNKVQAEFDPATIEALADALAKGGASVLRAVQAAINSSGLPAG